jgi:predicted dehydrogenase
MANLPTDRRDFVRTASLLAAVGPALAACSTAARPTPAQSASPAPIPPTGRPMGRINVGIVGYGKRASELLDAFMDHPGVEVVSVADVVDARRDECIRRVNAKRGRTVCTAARSWRELVSDPSIDAVVVATPDHWHAEPSIAACLAGKHVYCEKPLSLTLAEGRAIAAAARATGVTFQVGSQQRSEFNHMFATAAEAVRNGRLGTVKRVLAGVGPMAKPCDLPEEPLPPGIDWEAWLGQAPWRGFNHELCPIGMHGHYPAWRNYAEYANGGLADFGAHHFDIAQWALGMDLSGPVKVTPPADGARTGLVFTYASGIELVHGGPTDCTFIGTEGTIEVSRGHLKAYKGEDRRADPAMELLRPPGPGEVRLPRNRSHVHDFLTAIVDGHEPICTAETGHRTATLCHLAVIGYTIGQPLGWDPDREEFTGPFADRANALRGRAVRPHA